MNDVLVSEDGESFVRLFVCFTFKSYFIFDFLSVSLKLYSFSDFYLLYLPFPPSSPFLFLLLLLSSSSSFPPSPPSPPFLPLSLPHSFPSSLPEGMSSTIDTEVTRSPGHRGQS